MDKLRQHIWWIFGLGTLFSIILMATMAIYAWIQNYRGIESDLLHSHRLIEAYYLEKLQRLETTFRLLQSKDRPGDYQKNGRTIDYFKDIIEYDRGSGPEFFSGELIFDPAVLAVRKNNTLFAKNTFYSKRNKRWVTPFCYRFNESDFGCATIDFHQLSMPLKSISEGHDIFHIFVTLDYWLIHQSVASEKNYAHWYGQNMRSGAMKDLVDSHSDTIKQETGMTLDTLLAAGGSHIYHQRLRTGEQALIVLSGLPEYSFFVGSGFRYSDIWQYFLDYMYGMILMVIVFNTILLLLFKRYDTVNERHRRELEYRSMHDDLTGLMTRRASETVFTDDEPLAGPHIMMAVNIERFHLINERFGHEIGDSLLQYVTKRLKKHCGHKCHLLRDTGPDFIVITPGPDTDKALEWINIFVNEMARPLKIKDIVLKLTLNAGLFEGNLSDISYREALKRVDIALWKAKTDHEQIYTYTEKTHQQIIHRIHIREQLEYGLDNQEFYLVYQPQIDSQTGIMTGVEALARWSNSVLGSIPPNLFIGIAEESGLINDLGSLITSIALEEMAQVMAETDKQFSVSINFSLYQFFNTDILQEIDSMVKQSGFPGNHLVLEITESVFAADMGIIKEILDKLHSSGYQISLDDFGTGYSSLSMLSELPVDEVKIDKSFIDRIHESEPDYHLVKNILAIAKTLGLKIVAEGVEYEMQVELLCQANCDTIQGYLYSKPLSQEELKNFVTKAQVDQPHHPRQV